jgi:hypothetical protein
MPRLLGFDLVPNSVNSVYGLLPDPLLRLNYIGGYFVTDYDIRTSTRDWGEILHM